MPMVNADVMETSFGLIALLVGGWRTPAVEAVSRALSLLLVP